LQSAEPAPLGPRSADPVTDLISGLEHDIRTSSLRLRSRTVGLSPRLAQVDRKGERERGRAVWRRLRKIRGIKGLGQRCRRIMQITQTLYL
jgi:hypothetical protein